MDVAAGHGNRQPDRDVGRAHAVIVHRVLEAVDTVRQTGDGGAHARGGAGHDLAEAVADRGNPVMAEDLDQPAAAEPAGRDLGKIVAAPFGRNPHIEQDQIEQVLLQHALAEQAHHRDAQAFLVDLGQPAGHAAGHGTADIGMVGDVAHEGDEIAVEIHRHRHVDVRQMGAAGDMGIVGDEQVAVADIAVEAGEQAFHQPAHGGEMDRQGGIGLHDQAAGRVHDRRRMVAPFLDVGRIGALHQGGEGLVGDRAQAVGQDLQRDRVERSRRGGHVATPAAAASGLPTAMTRLPAASTATRSPGKATVVESSCSTMAGPVKAMPAASDSRR